VALSFRSQDSRRTNIAETTRKTEGGKQLLKAIAAKIASMGGCDHVPYS
jgi:hypothetical protein